jgi:hypothetical protein
MDHVVIALFIGTGATLTMDLWTFARGRLFGTPLPNYGLVGRWFAHMPRGRFRHDRIAAVPPVPGEQVIGWTAHYLIGIAFAGVLLAICGLAWARQPTFAPALALGVATVAAPLLLMQPGMGAGIAASRTPRPNAARAQSLVTHAVFGVGLYAAALVRLFLLGE